MWSQNWSTTGEQDGLDAIEPRTASPFTLLSRVDLSIPGKSERCWGSVTHLNRAGVVLHLQQRLQVSSLLTIRFRYAGDDEAEASEQLAARVLWQSGSRAGLEFLTALQHAPRLTAHLDSV